MASRSVVHLQLNHLYLIVIEFPTALDRDRLNPKDKPLKPLQKMLDLQTTDDPGSSMDYTIRRHTGLVLHYDARQSTAVIMIGSPHPRSFPMRYLPWEGTARLPYQPLECLKLPGAQFMRKGYLNYTHCVKVRVMTTRDSTPQLTTLFLRDEEVAKLTQLHLGYWVGVRYSKDGVPVLPSRPTDDGGQMEEISEELLDLFTKEEVSEIQDIARRHGLNMKTAIKSYRLGLCMLDEDEKCSQMELWDDGEVGPGGPIQKVDDLPRCYFFPIIQQVD